MFVKHHYDTHHNTDERQTARLTAASLYARLSRFYSPLPPPDGYCALGGTVAVSGGVEDEKNAFASSSLYQSSTVDSRLKRRHGHQALSRTRQQRYGEGKPPQAE